MLEYKSMFAPSYIAALVSILVQVLNALGVNIGSEALTTTITTLITLGSALFIAYRQIKMGRSTLGGARPR